MTFLLDENFPGASGLLLTAKGHTLLAFRNLGTPGASDEVVLATAQQHSAILLTTDRDFFHTLGRKARGHCGTVVIALKKPCRQAILSKLEWFLQHFTLEQIAGRAFQLRDQIWMVYPSFEAAAGDSTDA